MNGEKITAIRLFETFKFFDPPQKRGQLVLSK